jgi:hypothetical protein
MSPWKAMVVTLAGVNLVRATRRGVVVPIGSVLVLAALAFIGSGVATAPTANAVSVAISGAVIACWQPLVVCGGPRRIAAGLLALFVVGAAQFALLGTAAPPLMSIWVWLAALLFLADPSTRILRWVMALIGRPLTEATNLYGRGEAIGVLERWITLVVVLRGDYGAMGFILAAKALARHKRFETDADFAEYFLIGTLASVLMALGVAEGMRALVVVRP